MSRHEGGDTLLAVLLAVLCIAEGYVIVILSKANKPREEKP